MILGTSLSLHRHSEDTLRTKFLVSSSNHGTVSARVSYSVATFTRPSDAQFREDGNTVQNIPIVTSLASDPQPSGQICYLSSIQNWL